MTASRAELILAETHEDVSSLEAALLGEDPSLRALALGSLARLGALRSEQVTRALTDPDRNVRVRALEVAIPDASIELVNMLTDADDLVVETAAWALGEREDATSHAVAELSKIAGAHEISICREAAIAALGAIGSYGGLPAILAGLEDRAPVRRRAVLALAPFDGPEVYEALQRATQDRDRQVRQAAEDLL